MSESGSNAAPLCRVPLEGASGEATLVIALLPKTSHPERALRIADEDEARRWGTERVQLLEGVEYRYAVEGPADSISCGPEAVFTPDDASGTTGRLRPNLGVGRLVLTVQIGPSSYRAAVEVRSRKVDYLRDYRGMLRDLASVLTEVVMRHFAANTQRFASDTTRDPPTLYQRFAVLRSMLDDGALDVALREVVERPHRHWVRRHEALAPGRPLPSGSQVARQFGRPGPRRPWPGAPAGAAINTLPLQLDTIRTEETLDTAENRFVVYALHRWRSILDDLRGRVEANAQAEVDALSDRLSSHLRHAVFAEVGAMQRIPAESQVLQKREGYREVYRLFFAVETAALLAWLPDETTWHGGVRDVAALYEHWVYLRLAGVVSRVCGSALDPAALLGEDHEGLTVTLRRGAEPVIRATVTQLGRPIELALYYNRPFAGAASGGEGGSWTRGMRPDCSLQITPRSPDAEPMWLHFDAKYRVDRVSELFGGADEGVAPGRALRDDLAKMHAYRDAIRRTAGAFVVYPGDELARFPRYYELLPGLGAFPLAPTEAEGPARGEAELEAFVREVIDHAARRATQHERWRYWTSQIFATPPFRQGALSPVVEERPPADVGLLIAAVKSPEHLAWVRVHGRYNLRADGREGSVTISPALFAARYVLLHGHAVSPTFWRLGDALEAIGGEALAAMGYPEPGGTLYLLLRLEAELPLPMIPSEEALQAARGEINGSRSVPVLRTLEWLFGLEPTAPSPLAEIP